MTKKQIKNLCSERGFLLEFEVADEMYFRKRYGNHKCVIVINKDTFHNAYQLYDYYVVGKNYQCLEHIELLKNDLTKLLIDVSYLNNLLNKSE